MVFNCTHRVCQSQDDLMNDIQKSQGHGEYALSRHPSPCHSNTFTCVKITDSVQVLHAHCLLTEDARL